MSDDKKQVKKEKPFDMELEKQEVIDSLRLLSDRLQKQADVFVENYKRMTNKAEMQEAVDLRNMCLDFSSIVEEAVYKLNNFGLAKQTKFGMLAKEE